MYNCTNKTCIEFICNVRMKDLSKNYKLQRSYIPFHLQIVENQNYCGFILKLIYFWVISKKLMF